MIDLKKIIATTHISIIAVLITGCLPSNDDSSIPFYTNIGTTVTSPTPSNPATGVDYTDPSQFMQTISIPDHLNQVNAQSAHNNGFTGGNLSSTTAYTTVASDTSNRNLQTVVAVLDSGINAAHEDLDDTGKIEGWKDFTPANSLTSYDDIGHGTMVGHIIAGERHNVNDLYYGIAYDSNLLVGQIIENGTTDNIVLKNAIDWVVTQKGVIDIPDTKRLIALNLSLGTTDSAFLTAGFKSSLLSALNSGISIIVAAGNEGLSCASAATGNCSFPAAAPWVIPAETSSYLSNTGGWIVVGSVDSSNVISSFSNKAGATKSNYLVAPGENIIGAAYDQNNGYRIGSGTSFAAPIVSGAMALMAQKWPHLNGRQHSQILFDTATDLGAPGVDDVYGNGLLNLTDAFNPVGTVAIPTGLANVFQQNATQTLTNTQLTTSSALLSLNSLSALNNTIGIDSYKRDFKMNLTGTISTSGTAPVDFNNFLSFSYKNLIFGVDQLHDMPLIGYKLSKNSTIKLSYDDTFLGTQSEGALKLGKASTYYLGFNQSLINENDLQINFSTTYAYGQSSTTSNSLITDISDVHALGGEFNIIYKNIGIGYEIPLRTIKGEMTFQTPTDIDNQGNIVYSHLNTTLKPNSFQQTYSLFFEKRLADVYFLTKLSQTKDAFGADNLTDNAVKASLSYWY